MQAQRNTRQRWGSPLPVLCVGALRAWATLGAAARYSRGVAFLGRDVAAPGQHKRGPHTPGHPSSGWRAGQCPLAKTQGRSREEPCASRGTQPRWHRQFCQQGVPCSHIQPRPPRAEHWSGTHQGRPSALASHCLAKVNTAPSGLPRTTALPHAPACPERSRSVCPARRFAPRAWCRGKQERDMRLMQRHPMQQREGRQGVVLFALLTSLAWRFLARCSMYFPGGY